MLELPVEPYASLPDTDTGTIVAFDIGADGHPYLLTASRPVEYVNEVPGGAIFPQIRPKAPQRYHIYRLESGQPRLLMTVEDEAFNIHAVQPLGEDRFLLACARSQYRDEGADQNGRIYHSSGQFSKGVILGDGIGNLAVKPEGIIWAGYFDEGVFGNFGWSQPLGSSGLVAWREDGTKLYEFQPPEGLDHICDCYAVNACGEDLWICYDTDFPLVRIRDYQVVQHWEIPISGSGAFAISGDHALFSGDYEDRNQYHLLELSGPRAAIRASFKLHDRDGAIVDADRVAERGENLFVLRGREVFKIGVAEAKERFRSQT